MFKHIIAAQDGSPCSDRALEYAAQLARTCGSTLPGIVSDPAPVYAALERERHDVEKHVNDTLQGTGVTARISSSSGVIAATATVPVLVVPETAERVGHRLDAGVG